MTADNWEPGKLWRVVAPDGTVWCETSNQEEARRECRPDDELYRQWTTTKTEWRREH